MNRMFRQAAFFPAIAVLFFSTRIASAQWIGDSTTNTPICTVAGSQHTNPRMCSDGANGAIIVWQDTRINGGMNIFAQRVSASGKTMWAAGGVRLSTPSGANADQENAVIAPDGAGGAYVVWEDYRNSSNGIDLYGQHIQGNGTLAGGPVGFAVCEANGDQVTPAICPDGNGGAFVAWGDNRAFQQHGYAPNLYFNHLAGGGAQFGSAGRVADTAIGTQRNPAICDDGSGGCFIAWEDGSVVPYSIRANHFSAGGGPYWGTHGIQIYRTDCGTCYTANASHVSIRRDGTQLMLAWQTTSLINNSQNIMAARIRNSNSTDSTQVWGQAVDVTGDIPYDQTLPQIFSDDSAVAAGANYRGILVPFEYAWPGAADDWNPTMIRILGDGSTQLPGSGSVYTITSQPHGQVGLQTVQINSNILAVWNDARFGSAPDTCIYAQMIDKYGNRFFPSYRTNSTWGLPICRRATTSKQVVIAPRTDGAIVAWTDFRAGTSQPNIYAQLVLASGARALDNLPPQAVVISQSASFDGSECNAQCTTVLALDTGRNQTGLDSIVPIALSNMKFTPATFAVGDDSAVFSLCVKDSFQAGSAEIALMDAAHNRDTFDFSYCPIADTSAPYITWDSTGEWITLHILDNRPWDRGLAHITVTDSSNIMFLPSLAQVRAGTRAYTTAAAPIDPSQPSQFCIAASDTAGNLSQPVCFSRSVAGVRSERATVFSLLVNSGSESGAISLQIKGAPSAHATIYDMLGRAVAQFTMQTAYEWNPGGLPAGAYFIVATSGTQHASAWIIRN